MHVSTHVRTQVNTYVTAHSYGLYRYGLYRYGLHSNGLYSYGLYSNDLYIYEVLDENGHDRKTAVPPALSSHSFGNYTPLAIN